MAIPRTIIDPLDSRREGRGLRWLGWEPRGSQPWRLWRTGDRPLEFDGVALTPRFAIDDEVPPFERFDEICRQFDHDATDHCSFYLDWPDHDVRREELALTCDRFEVDALVVRADSGQYVLGWTEEAFGTPGPPRGEVREPYPFPDEPDDGPSRFVSNSLDGGVRFRVEVFDSAAELRTFVDSGAEGRLTATSAKVVRWAVDLASEYDPALDVPATAQRLGDPAGSDGHRSTGAARGSTCSVCGEVRPLVDFYDDLHAVWMLDREPWVHIDHGEAAALLPPVDPEVREQAAALADRLARAGREYEWLSVFDLDAEEACCGARDHWGFAQHLVDHGARPLIEIAASGDSWALSPWIATSADDPYAVVHEPLQSELLRRGYEPASNGLSWEDRHYDDPGNCANDLLALLEGAGITRPLVVQRAKPSMGEVVETILPEPAS